MSDEPCPTCSGPIRETVGMVCQTCGTDYGPPTAGAPEVVVDFDQLESLAAGLTEVIQERAATWETQFDAGPGAVVSVSDAAWVIAKRLLTAAVLPVVAAEVDAAVTAERERVAQAIERAGQDSCDCGCFDSALAARIARDPSPVLPPEPR